MDGSDGHKPLAYSYVRMSTGIQLKGHSKQRQLEKSTAYAKEHGLRLVGHSQLEDLGVSAFKGANVKDGALGQFLGAVENGKVPAGSYLLVKSLDRISRQDVLPSLTLFLRILGLRIVLVTLQDGRVYDENSKADDLIISLAIMSRAHEESQLKSERVGSAWATKRSNADKSKLTKWCPAWLRPISDERIPGRVKIVRYELWPERVKIVRSIFEDTVAGIGGLAITKRLNKKNNHWGSSKGWHPSYVAKILNNRAVIGEFQPRKLSPEGKSRPEGPAVKDYFPAIINEELFYRARQARSERLITGRGRKGQYLSNLFSGLATCEYCHSKMKFNNKGPPPKGGTFLVCEASKRGLGCVTTGWRYEQFETSFLALVEQLDLPALIRSDNSKTKELDEAIEALQGHQLALREEMEKAYGLLKINSSLEFVAEKLGALNDELKSLDARLEEKRAERNTIEATENAFYESKDQINSLIARLQNVGHGDIYKLRSQVATRVKALVSELRVAPSGTAPIKEAWINHVQSNATGDDDLKALLLESIVDAENRRYFTVTFRDGSKLQVFPTDDDPLCFVTRHLSEVIGKGRGPMPQLKGWITTMDLPIIKMPTGRRTTPSGDQT